MEIEKAKALDLLGIRPTSFYTRVNKLGIKPILKTVWSTKASFISKADLEKMASAMGKTIQRDQTPKEKTSENASPVDETAPSKKKEEQFDLMIKIRQQEEQIKSSTEMVDFYKKQSTVLLNQQQEVKIQINDMYVRMIKVTNKATAFWVTAIALAVILIVFIVLVVLGKLQF